MIIDNSQIVFDEEVNNEQEINNEGSTDNNNADDTNNSGEQDSNVEENDTGSNEENNTNDEAESDNDNDEVSVLDILTEITGFKDITDEEGNVIQFDDTEEGIRAYVSKVNEQLVINATNEATNKLFTQHPEIKDAYNYLRINGSLEGFNQKTNWDGITLDESQTDSLKNVIKEHYKILGTDVKDSYIKYLEESGELFNEAKSSLEFLKENDSNTKAAMEEQLKEAERLELESNIAYWKNIENSINEGSILGYKLPDNITVNKDGKTVVKSKSDFYNYMSKAVKDGKSQYELDLEAQDTNKLNEEEIFRAYLKFTGNDYKSIVKMEINKEKVDTNKRLRVKTQKSTNTNEAKTNEKVSNDQIVLEI